MMRGTDYRLIASALCKSLDYGNRVRVYRHLCPVLIAQNGKFDPIKFGEDLGIPLSVRRMMLTDHINKEEVNSDAG